MAIKHSTTPAGTWLAFDDGLNRLGIPPRSGAPRTMRTRRRDLPIVSLELKNLPTSGGLGRLSSTLRRCIEPGLGGPTMAGDVKVTGGGVKPKLVCSSKDPRIGEELTDLLDLDKKSQVRARDYEPQLLRIPGLLIEAFRLQPLARGGECLVVPIRTASAAVQRGQVYTETDFFQRIKPLVATFQRSASIKP